MKAKKYLVRGGWVVSRHDGDDHYIGPGKVAELYGVNPEECVFLEMRKHLTTEEKKLICLFPRSDGKYNLPKI